MTDSDSTPILIEFSPRPGVEAVAIFDTNTEEIRRKSEEALNNAMKKIEEMALVGGSALSNGCRSRFVRDPVLTVQLSHNSPSDGVGANQLGVALWRSDCP